MTTRPYSDLLATVEALCGAELAAAERARIKYFVNRRARKAYAESRYWPRFLKVEERIVSEDGLLPYEQDGLSTIGTAFRVHATRPYLRVPAIEFINFAPTNVGIQVANFNESAKASVTISGTLTPDATGDYLNVGTEFDGVDTGKPIYRLGSATLEQYPAGAIIWNNTVWQLFWFESESDVSLWNSFEDVATPDLVTTWTPVIDAVGTPTVEAADLYSVYVTHKAALTDTYGDGDGEESDVPEEWFDYLIAASYSDFLRNDGQNEKAMAEEANANELLQQQLERLDTSGSFLFGKILSHNNTQTR